jgi:hypothetical protein
MPASLLFTGHVIDKPERPKPRFPPRLARAARLRIRAAIASYLEGRPGKPLVGFASGARGGDILFHEECRAAGIATMIVLPFAPEVFISSSVELTRSDQGRWIRRFRKLWRETPERMREVMDLPQNDDAYARCNRRLIALAKAHGKVHLIALWDGKRGDGPGGASDMVAHADADGKPDIIAPQSLEERR